MYLLMLLSSDENDLKGIDVSNAHALGVGLLELLGDGHGTLGAPDLRPLRSRRYVSNLLGIVPDALDEIARKAAIPTPRSSSPRRVTRIGSGASTTRRSL